MVVAHDVADFKCGVSTKREVRQRYSHGVRLPDRVHHLMKNDSARRNLTVNIRHIEQLFRTSSAIVMLIRDQCIGNTIQHPQIHRLLLLQLHQGLLVKAPAFRDGQEGWLHRISVRKISPGIPVKRFGNSNAQPEQLRVWHPMHFGQMKIWKLTFNMACDPAIRGQAPCRTPTLSLPTSNTLRHQANRHLEPKHFQLSASLTSHEARQRRIGTNSFELLHPRTNKVLPFSSIAAVHFEGIYLTLPAENRMNTTDSFARKALTALNKAHSLAHYLTPSNCAP